MADTTDPDPDPHADGRPEAPIDDRAEPADRRPWYRSPVVWTAVTVAVIAGALGVSVLAGTDALDPDPEPGFDHAAYCARSVEFRDVSSGSIDLTTEASKIRRMADAMSAMRAAAPPRVVEATGDWAAGLYDAARKVELVVGKYGKDAPETALGAEQAVASVGDEKAASVQRVSTYTKKVCNLDLFESAPDAIPPESTTPDPTPSGPLPTASPATDATAPVGSAAPSPSR